MERLRTVALIMTPIYCGVCLFVYGLIAGWIKLSLSDDAVQLAITLFIFWLVVASFLFSTSPSRGHSGSESPWEKVVKNATVRQLNGHEVEIEKDGIREIVGQDVNGDWYHKSVDPDGRVGPITYGSDRNVKGSRASVIAAVKYRFNSRK